LDPTVEKKIIGELGSYFQEKVAELRRDGLNDQDAVRQAIHSFGRAKTVARMIYAAHSKGSWMEALLACQPHLIMAGLFTTHLWSRPLYLGIAVFFILAVGLMGWWRYRPNWIFPWIGHSLVFLISGMYMTRDVPLQALSAVFGWGTPPSGTALIVVLLLYGFSLWIIFHVLIRVIRRDWILASLLLLPLPVLGLWVYIIGQETENIIVLAAELHRWDDPVVLGLLALGIGSVLFVRLRQRFFKILTLLSVVTAAGGILIISYWQLSLTQIIAAVVLLPLILLIPAVLGKTAIRKQEPPVSIEAPAGGSFLDDSL
jgi:hypothetical protein